MESRRGDRMANSERSAYYRSVASRRTGTDEYNNNNSTSNTNNAPTRPTRTHNRPWEEDGSGSGSASASSGRRSTPTNLSGRVHERRLSTGTSPSDRRSSSNGRGALDPRAEMSGDPPGRSRIDNTYATTSGRRSVGSVLPDRTYDSATSRGLSISEHRSSLAPNASRDAGPMVPRAPTSGGSSYGGTSARNTTSLSGRAYEQRLSSTNTSNEFRSSSSGRMGESTTDAASGNNSHGASSVVRTTAPTGRSYESGSSNRMSMSEHRSSHRDSDPRAAESSGSEVIESSYARYLSRNRDPPSGTSEDSYGASASRRSMSAEEYRKRLMERNDRMSVSDRTATTRGSTATETSGSATPLERATADYQKSLRDRRASVAGTVNSGLLASRLDERRPAGRGFSRSNSSNSIDSMDSNERAQLGGVRRGSRRHSVTHAPAVSRLEQHPDNADVGAGRNVSLEVGGSSGNARLEASREMRNRRLRGDTGTVENPTVIDVSDFGEPGMHYAAHSPAVEKYLNRKSILEGVRTRDSSSKSRIEPSRSRELASSSLGEHERQSQAQVDGQLSRTATENDAGSRDQSPRMSEVSVRERVKRTESSERLQPVLPRVPAAIADKARYRDQPSSTSRLNRDPPPGIEHTMSEDSSTSATSASLKGWSTIRSRQSQDSQSKVDEYLAARTARRAASAVTPTLLSSSRKERFSSPRKGRSSLESAGAALVMEEEEEEEESSETETEGESDDSSVDVPNVQEYSVRVCVVSAIDLPDSVVPNLPFSTQIKLGLVKMPPMQGNPQDERVDEQRLRSFTEMIEKDGLTSISKARVLSTTTKVLSKRDNGSVEFHEELRWDRVKEPQQMALALELSSRAVLTPANFRESPPSQSVEPFSISSATNSIGRGPDNRTGEIGDAGSGASALGNLFRRSKKNESAEMETANAAAAVAKLLVEGEEEETGPLFDSKSTNTKSLTGSQNEVDVKLRKRKRRRKTKMSEDFRIGAKIIPFVQLPLHEAHAERKTARIEQWFEFHIANSSSDSGRPSSPSSKRCPRILLEISLSTPEVRDDSEDELEEDTAEKNVGASFSKRASSTIRNQLKDETAGTPEDVEEPTLHPGVIDFVCVVGARDIGDQKADDGSRGWVNSTPECSVLEQFPPDDEFHARMGRNAVLPTKVEWFCFPEGCRLWRGTTPPNHEELNLKRFSASSPANMSTTFASFDACLGCTSSFIWFSIASNSDEYGSENAKTYGTVIRFYVPAPTGIDPTQDDFAQTMMGVQQSSITQVTDAKRLWVPIGICLLSSLPIIGAMEVILLRLCEGLANSGMNNAESSSTLGKYIFDEISHLVLKYQRPIPGIVSCSIPFLSGARLHLSLPSRSGIPPLPHGNAVTSVCRLLGADGLNYLLAACLTECKILLHSDDVANTALVAEVLTALIYPFQWSCPFVPVLPFGMMEVVEAPCPFLLGIPSCNLKYIDPPVLEDIVVVDLDRDFSSEYHEGRRVGVKTKSPAPLPATTATNISKAVYRLLRTEAEAAEAISGQNFSGARQFPWLEPESVAEREFRVNVAIEISSLLQGFQDCLVYAAEQPVFNVDKFMQQAPALFEEQRGKNIAGQGPGQFLARRVISPRSRKFLSEMVNGQQFHQFLESLDTDSVSFYHEIVKVLENKSPSSGSSLLLNKDKVVNDLNKILQKHDDRIATYRVKKLTEDNPALDASDQGGGLSSFPSSMLQPIKISNDSQDDGDESTGQSGGVRHVSIEYLVELEKNPWRYEKVMNVELEESAVAEEVCKVKLRDALGEKRYRAWKMSIESDKYEGEDSTVFTDGARSHDEVISLDISSLLVADDKARRLDDSRVMNHVEQATESSAQRRIADAKDRDVLRRCLERAQVAGGKETSTTSDAGRDLITEAEIALRNPSAREFLLSILDRRSQELLEKKDGPPSKRRAAFKMEPHAFEVLVRLGCAMLDACLETQDFTSAYALLKSTAGLYCPATRAEPTDTYMTGRICLHPIYSNLALWESIQLARTNARGDNTETGEDHDSEEDEYESTVTTLYEMQGYGIPVEELARFASHVCEKKDWVHSERGKKLMMLARRLSLRREHSRLTHTRSGRSDIEMMSPISVRKRRDLNSLSNALSPSRKLRWVEAGWCHPAAQSSRRPLPQEKLRRSAGPSSPEQSTMKAGPTYMKRSAITCMAYLGSSVVVTGGLDGGVFVARSVVEGDPIDSSKREDNLGIRGVHLDWGSSGSRYSVGATSSAVDGEYGVGAVSCLAATRGSQLSYQTPRSVSPGKGSKDSAAPPQDDEILAAMDGFRVVAGTTCGDLRVWSIKDVFAAIFYSAGGGLSTSSFGDGRVQHRGEMSSSYIRRIGVTDFAAGSSLTRLKFSLRGRALSGHRGGVSCIDVPSNVYRPDSIVSGGADGLIKLWSLRTPGTAGARRADIGTASTFLKKAGAEALSPRTKAAKSGDALSILSGHGGRVLCVKTAWHGDRLLSGGVDRTVRIWDLAGAGGKCLNTLTGHTGWVTNTQYWGANTIISASTDRSIALWDARVRSTPLFALRHHYGPISDILVGSRTDPIMISAASDGTIAAWDFRHLAGSIEDSDISARRCCIVRDPAAKLYMHDFSSKKHVFGPVMLGRGTSEERRTVSCLGGDAVLREWDFQTGEIVVEHVTGHCDTVSSFISLSDDRPMESQVESNTSEVASSTITASWDGTVRMRRLVAM